MKWISESLDFPSKDRKKDFVLALSDEIKQRMPERSGRSTIISDFNSISRAEGCYSFHADSRTVVFELIDKAEHKLELRVGVNCSDTEAETYHQEIKKHILRALIWMNALPEKDYFYRSLYYYYGPELDGEFWLGNTRMAPVGKNAAKHSPYLSEACIAVETTVASTDNFLDKIHKGRSKTELLADRLSLIFDIGLRSEKARFIWTHCSNGEDNIDSKRVQSGYIGPDIAHNSLPPKGRLAQQSKWDCNLTNSKNYQLQRGELTAPKELRRIFRALDACPETIKSRFDACARMIRVANCIEQDFRTPSLAYKVAGIECLCDSNNSSNVIDFIKKHSSPSTRESATYLYNKVRSSHFHAGIFPIDDEINNSLENSVFMLREDMENDMLHRECHEIVREVIVNCLLDLADKFAPQ